LIKASRSNFETALTPFGKASTLFAHFHFIESPQKMFSVFTKSVAKITQIFAKVSIKLPEKLGETSIRSELLASVK
jgi:hypothetical protein